MAEVPALLTEMAVEAKTLRLFLDYDGTLAEFEPTPAIIRPNQVVIAILEKLVATPGSLPAVITGRRLKDIEKLLPVKGLLLGGTYGIEMRLSDGSERCALPLEAARPLVEQVLPRWEQIVAGYEGFTLEDKGWTVAMHSRYASAADAEKVLPRALKQAEALLRPEFRLIMGERFLEFAPRAANKKTAVEAVLTELTPAEAQVIYVGDDQRDEEAFEAVLGAGGQAARVMPWGGQTRAPFRFDSPAEVRAWLGEVLEGRKKKEPQPRKAGQDTQKTQE